jgi:hypothetical protein
MGDVALVKSQVSGLVEALPVAVLTVNAGDARVAAGELAEAFRATNSAEGTEAAALVLRAVELVIGVVQRAAAAGDRMVGYANSI